MSTTSKAKTLKPLNAGKPSDGIENGSSITAQTPRTTMFFANDVDVTANPPPPAQQNDRQPSPPPKNTPVINNPRAAVQSPQSVTQSEHNLRSMPHTVSASALTSGSGFSRHPYGRAPNAASMSHGNLVETASIASSGVGDNVTVMSETDHRPSYARKTSAGDKRGGHTKRDTRQVFRNFINRTNSTRQDEDQRTAHLKPRIMTSRKHLQPEPEQSGYDDIRTAPLDPDRGFRDMMDSRNRNKSADRMLDTDETHSGKTTSMSKDGAELWANIKHGSSSAAAGLGRGAKGLFSKLKQGSNDSSRDQSIDEDYQLKVINLPLIPQVRKTRLQSKMEDARDKTEFWMPSLPYRCIDFLNFKGVEEEGIYRIPGSGKEVKRWQARFDKELDVNLLDEEELYDINIVASMLKAWLRDLPEELFPKSTQAKIANAFPDATETPQMLKDELSKLPPFNYYTLFAITCHISVLHSHSDKNKMNYGNLMICFQPCLKVEGYCFNFLVKDWKNCWTQGCWTEKTFLEQEYALQAQEAGPPSTSSSITKPQSSSSTKGSAVTAASTSTTNVPAKPDRYGPGSESSSRTTSRPTTGRKTITTSSRTPTASSAAGERNDMSLPQSPRSPTHANGGTSTPPRLGPMETFSPMRM